MSEEELAARVDWFRRHPKEASAWVVLDLADARDKATARATLAEQVATDLYADRQHTDGYRVGVADERARVAALVMAVVPAYGLLLQQVRGASGPIIPPNAAILARLLALTEACRPFAVIGATVSIFPDHYPVVVSSPDAVSPATLGHCRRLAALLATEEATDAATD